MNTNTNTKENGMSMKRVPVELGEEREGDLVLVDGRETPLVGSESGPYIEMDSRVLYARDLRDLGVEVVREVEEHPSRALPAEPGTVITIGRSHYLRPVVFERWGGGWLETGRSGTRYDSDVQRLVDVRGFTVLVPETEVAEAREEADEAGFARGFQAGIREAVRAVETVRGHEGTLSRVQAVLSELTEDAGAES